MAINKIGRTVLSPEDLQRKVDELVDSNNDLAQRVAGLEFKTQLVKAPAQPAAGDNGQAG